jgi:hypothetical protein
MQDTGPTTSLTFIVSPEALKGFSRILQQGFFAKVTTGSTLEEVLIEQLGIEGEYIEKRISTIFLDGHPVDDLHGTLVHDGSVLSLSAAMPGLVGATMRRKGAYASFRSAIAYHEKEGADVRHEGLIEVRLFNLLMVELGPHFFKRGIYVRSDDLADLISPIMADLRSGCRLILLNDRSVPGDAVPGILKNMGSDLIQVFVIQQKDVVL